ncbi:hypothetical protein CYMTET_25301 [Cymbomonas tetramitiformis]|uniref:Sodium/calcium exchanger membrane region domain-containing protein n=1 Tax=Cymbomonas tetramitiformis TaxID=36881 RepID=A0AAE0FUB2_9CHLO|nr:hypothetical protein CYMTET_25301 [Cymbomonas tetramitiformis]
MAYSSYNGLQREASTSIDSAASNHHRHMLGGEYPDDLFDSDQRKEGAIILHVIGVLYMFVALAIVCDEFFVPALEEIGNRYDITEDVAGATLMAAGGSAPELFTSIIGVFIAESNVGFGTIIGSAVFNVLFVIGMCAIFSSGLLALTWWPLARDCTFYTVDLCILFIFFRDEKIQLWESGLMLILYLCYVGFMFINEPAEKFVKSMLGSKVNPSDDPEGGDEKEAPKPNLVQLSQVKRNILSSTFQLMISQEKGPSPGRGKARFQRAVTLERIYTNSGKEALERVKEVEKRVSKVSLLEGDNLVKPVASSPNGGEKEDPDKKEEEGEEEEEGEGMDLSWPDTPMAQLTFVLLAPLTFSLAYTLPDTRVANRKDYWYISFAGSIIWIGFYSYWMVWWATLLGVAMGIDEVVMGYTFLAAGTSVPDLMSSVLVAQQGQGDMAVSSSIGSNIFDITFGLPLPWFLWSLANGKEMEVESNSLEFSLVLLIIMLVLVVMTIALSGWVMTKALGGCMFGLYGVFLTLVLLKSAGKLDFVGL